MEALDCEMAPCGVPHGRSRTLGGRSHVGGFASPPQLDLYMRTEFYREGSFSQPPAEVLG